VFSSCASRCCLLIAGFLCKTRGVDVNCCSSFWQFVCIYMRFYIKCSYILFCTVLYSWLSDSTCNVPILIIICFHCLTRRFDIIRGSLVVTGSEQCSGVLSFELLRKFSFGGIVLTVWVAKQFI